MRKLFIAAAAVAVAAATVATPAFAQEADGNFNGFHIDAVTGYDHFDGGEGQDGILYGVGAGYDFRIDNVVLGIEGEALESTAGDCAVGTCVDAGRDLYIGGRVGALVAPNVLLYGKVGYSNARIEVSSAGSNYGLNFDGIRAGAGVEWQFRNSPISLRAEYRYSNYEDDIERHQGTVGLAFRF